MLAAATGVAYAAIPDAGGVIHGCYSKSKGALRIVDSEQGEACSANETALDWNHTGPPGATGATGPAGPEARTLTFNVPAGGELVPLTFLNGLVVKGACGVNESTVLVDVDPSAVIPGVTRGRLFGYTIDNDGMHPVRFLQFGGVSATAVEPVISVVGGLTSPANGNALSMARIDIEGSNGGGLDCKFDAMITRSG